MGFVGVTKCKSSVPWALLIVYGWLAFIDIKMRLWRKSVLPKTFVHLEVIFSSELYPNIAISCTRSVWRTTSPSVWSLITDLLDTIHDFKKTLLSILELLVQYGDHLPHHFHDHVVIQCAAFTQRDRLSHLCKLNNETEVRSIMSHTKVWVQATNETF